MDKYISIFLLIFFRMNVPVMGPRNIKKMFRNISFMGVYFAV